MKIVLHIVLFLVVLLVFGGNLVISFIVYFLILVGYDYFFVKESPEQPSIRRKTKLEKLGYSSYNEYLDSYHWRNIKERFYQTERIIKLRNEYGHLVCEKCHKGSDLYVHHTTYKHLGFEGLWDLQLLCRGCHDNIHWMKQIKREFISD